MDLEKLKKIGSQFSASDISADIQSLLETERWKAKFEMLQGALENERKERKELETNLNKLAFELGGAKNEIQRLENKIKLLTEGRSAEELPQKKKYPEKNPKESAKIKKEEKSLETGEKSKKEIFHTNESVRMQQQEMTLESGLKKPEIETENAKEKKCEVVEEAVDPPKLFEELWAEQFKEEEKEGDLEIKSAITAAYQEQAEKVWELGDAILEALNESPHELCYNFSRKKSSEGSIYNSFIEGVAMLNSEFGKYRNIVGVVDYDLKNLDKVIPHIKNTCVSIFHSD